MTQDLSWIDEFFGPPEIQKDGEVLPRRRALNFEGETVLLTDNPANNRIDITFSFDGGAPISNASTGTLNNVTTLNSGAPTGAIRFSGAAPVVNGLTNGTPGRKLILMATGGPLVLAHEAGASTAANRIVTSTGASVTIPNGAGVLLAYDDTSSRWRIAGAAGGATPGGSDGDFQIKSGTSLVGRAPEGVYVTDYGAVGDGTTDDSGAFRAAIAAAATGRRVVIVPALPSGQSYHFASKVVVNEPVTIRGQHGAMWGTGRVVISLAAGLESAFTFVPANVAGGTGAIGAVLEGVQIDCDSTLTTVAYAASTSYTAGQLIKRSNHVTSNCYVLEVIKAGTTAAETEAVAIDAVDPHVPDRATVWAPGTAVVAGQQIRSISNTHWDVIFTAGSAGTTGASEPTWNTTHNATTSDNGITWTCYALPGNTVIALGSAICKVRVIGGLYLTCPVVIRDVLVRNAALACVSCIGNSTVATLNSDAQRVLLQDLRVTLCSGGRGVGVYLRGGEFRDLVGINVHAIGSSETGGKGFVALPTDGTQNEIGILDHAFAGANSWHGCNVRLCLGYDIAAVGSSASTFFLGCISDGGRVRMDAGNTWVGPAPVAGQFWNANGNQFYSGGSTSVTGGGLLNAYELQVGVYAGLNNRVAFHWWQDATDTGVMGYYPSSGWNVLGWAGPGFASYAVSNRQVAASTHLPAGEEGGVLRLPRGFAYGTATDYNYTFASVDEFVTTLRGGFRRVGDKVLRPDRATAAGAYAADIVVTDGYTGLPWHGSTVKVARVAPPSSSAHVADIVVPTDTSNTNAFKCTTAGTTHATIEPDWSTAASLGDTISDGTVVWTNVGSQPVLESCDYVGSIPKPLTAGSNITLTDLGTSIQIDASGGGGGGSSAGGAGAVQVSDGAGGFSDPGDVVAGSGRVALGSGAATSGRIGVPYNASAQSLIRGWWHPSFEVDILKITGSTIGLGNINTTQLEIFSTAVQIWSGASDLTLLTSGGVVSLALSDTAAKFGVPLAGNAATTKSFTMDHATVSMASSGNTNASDAEAACPFLTLSGTTNAATYTMPDHPKATHWIKNSGSGDVTVKKPGGTGVVITAGSKALVHHNGTDYETR